MDALGTVVVASTVKKVSLFSAVLFDATATVPSALVGYWGLYMP